MRDEDHLNMLLDGLKLPISILRAKKFFGCVETIEECATQLRVLFDDVEDLAAQVAELSEALRRVEQDRDDLREELYYAQDRLDEARQIEAGLRADLKGMSDEVASLRDTIAIQQEDL